MGLGMANVIISSYLAYTLYRLPTPEKRSCFAFQTQHWQDFLTAAYVSSLLTWFSHFGFSAILKLPNLSLGPLTVSISIVGVATICLYWLRLRCIFGRFERVTIEE